MECEMQQISILTDCEFLEPMKTYGELLQENKIQGTNDDILDEMIKRSFDTSPIFTPSNGSPKANIYQQGWVCPKCGAVMSPNTNVCPFCAPGQNITITY